MTKLLSNFPKYTLHPIQDIYILDQLECTFLIESRIIISIFLYYLLSFMNLNFLMTILTAYNNISM